MGFKNLHSHHLKKKKENSARLPEIHIIMYLPQKPFIEHNLDQSCVCKTAFYDPVFVAFLLHWTMHTFVVPKVTA